MWRPSTALAVGAALLLAASSASPAAPREEPTGLWSSSFEAHQSVEDCGIWRLNSRDFCVANDGRNGLEVGTRFQTSTPVEITGVRIYRVDSEALRATLWDAEENVMARGEFPAGDADGWQDLHFSEPVTVSPGSVYTVSYFTPGTKYAFQYRYFAAKSRTVGPITALQSVDDRPNGVYCYEDANCGSYPVRGYRHATYWVSPLWLSAEGPGGPGIPGQTPNPPSQTSPPGSGPGAGKQVAPRVTSSVPAKGAKRIQASARIKVNFSTSLSTRHVTASTVRLVRAGTSKTVPARVRYADSQRRAVLRPRHRLRAGTTYRVVITTRVRDRAGNRFDQRPRKPGLQRAQWRFRTR